MDKRKRKQWVITFAILTLYSVHAVRGLSGRSTVSAYAAAARELPAIQDGGEYLIVRSHPTRAAQADVLQAVRLFSAPRRELCAATPEQRAALDRLGIGRTVRVEWDGERVPVRDVYGHAFSRQQLDEEFQRQGLGALSCGEIETSRPVIPLPPGPVS